jgi:hypothetical protein
MIFTLLTVTIASPVIYILLMCARNQNNRTLINQLQESIGWVALGWNFIAQPFQSISFLFYPIDSLIVCRAIFTVRSMFGQPPYFFGSAALIVR